MASPPQRLTKNAPHIRAHLTLLSSSLTRNPSFYLGKQWRTAGGGRRNARGNLVKIGNGHEHDDQGLTYDRFEWSVEAKDGWKEALHGEVTVAGRGSWRLGKSLIPGGSLDHRQRGVVKDVAKGVEELQAQAIGGRRSGLGGILAGGRRSCGARWFASHWKFWFGGNVAWGRGRLRPGRGHKDDIASCSSIGGEGKRRRLSAAWQRASSWGA